MEHVLNIAITLLSRHHFNLHTFYLLGFSDVIWDTTWKMCLRSGISNQWHKSTNHGTIEIHFIDFWSQVLISLYTLKHSGNREVCKVKIEHNTAHTYKCTVYCVKNNARFEKVPFSKMCQSI